MSDSMKQQHDSNQSDEEISEDEWVRLYERGYLLGTHNRSQENRTEQCDVTEQLAENHTLSDVEVSALQSGFELGRDAPYPALKINVRKRATTAFTKHA